MAYRPIGPEVWAAIRRVWQGETILQDAWSGRETVEFALPPSALALEPGDSIALETAEGTRLVMLSEATGGAARRVRARAVDRRDYRVTRGPAREASMRGAPAIGAPAVAVIEPPLLPGRSPALYFAAFADPWPGAVELFLARPSGTHEPAALLEAPAAMGTLAAQLWPGPLWRWDRANEILVDMPGAVPMPAGEADVLDGANAAAVQAADGTWEIVQFADVELVAPGRYRLTTLLRGQAGSEAAAMVGAPQGAPMVLLDEALAVRELGPDAIGLARGWRFVPAGATLDDPAAVAETVTPSGLAYRPLAPAHVHGRRDHASGDWHIGWIRRTRTGGDSWAHAEVPLGEAEERYVLDILDTPGGQALRSVEPTESFFLYDAAMQTQDFGAPVWSVPVRVRQASTLVGPGAPAEAILWHFKEIAT